MIDKKDNNSLIVEVNGFHFEFVEYAKLRQRIEKQGREKYSEDEIRQMHWNAFVNEVTDNYIRSEVESLTFPKQLFLKAGDIPSDKTIELLQKITKKMEEVEEKTGISFPRNVKLTFDISAVSLDDQLQIRYRTALDDDISFSMLENELYHETSHLHHEDLKAFNALLRCKSCVAPLTLMTDIYRDNPELLYSIVADGYRGEVDWLESLVDEFSAGLGDYLSPMLTPHPNALGYSDADVLKNMYKDGTLDEALHQMFEADAYEMFGATSTLSIIFSNKVKEIIENSSKEEVVENVRNHLTIEPPKLLTSGDKKNMDRLISEKVEPVLKRIEEIERFYEQYSMATEYRCDDYVMAMSDNPNTVVDWLGTLYRGEGIDAGFSKEEKERTVNVHPPTSARIARAEVLADMVTKARAENPEADVFALVKTGSHTVKELDKRVEKSLKAYRGEGQEP